MGQLGKKTRSKPRTPQPDEGRRARHRQAGELDPPSPQPDSLARDPVHRDGLPPSSTSNR